MAKFSTGKILLLSALAVCVCFAMLLGTTFAWFTDTKSVTVNSINTGEFKIDIVEKNSNTTVTTRELNFVRLDGTQEVAIDPNTETMYWEPAATYRTETFRVVNQGNYAVKFTIADIFTNVNGTYTTSGASDLKAVLDYTVYCNGSAYMNYDGATGTATYIASSVAGLDDGEIAIYPVGNADSKPTEASFFIEITMDENAGNEYQNCSVSGMAVYVSAAQMTYEKDYTGDQYDVDALYKEQITP